MDAKIAPVFPYYGGKAKRADEFWQRVGRVDVYLEPFAGSLAVLLRSGYTPKLEIVCDIDPLVVNFWRAIQRDYKQVAFYADYPSYHDDLTARHKWLVRWKAEQEPIVHNDLEYYDCKAAGWYAWGSSNWVGSRFCHKDQPYDQRPHMTSGQGVQVNRLSLSKSIPVGEGRRLYDMLGPVSERVKNTIVLHGDWKSVFDYQSEIDKHGSVGVFLDPPYVTESRGDLYLSDFDGTSDDVAHESYLWSLEHDDRYKIAYCAHEGDFEFPDDWSCEAKHFPGIRKVNKTTKDAIWYSQLCGNLSAVQKGLL